MISKLPLNRAVPKVAEMILAVSTNQLREDKEKALRVIMEGILSDDTEYPEHPWTKVSGYIEGYAAVPDKTEMYEDGLQDSISDQIGKLQSGEVQNIDIKEVGNKKGYTVFKFTVEFLYETQPNSEIAEGVYEVAENIPYILSNPKPKIDASTDLGGWDTPKR
jgi:hypothetical protein